MRLDWSLLLLLHVLLYCMACETAVEFIAGVRNIHEYLISVVYLFRSCMQYYRMARRKALETTHPNFFQSRRRSSSGSTPTSPVSTSLPSYYDTVQFQECVLWWYPLLCSWVHAVFGRLICFWYYASIHCCLEEVLNVACAYLKCMYIILLF